MDAQDLNPLAVHAFRQTRRARGGVVAVACARAASTAAALSAGAMLAVGSGARADGLVGCWGINDFGQCVVPPSVVIATQVAAGSDHSGNQDSSPATTPQTSTISSTIVCASIFSQII